MFSSSKKPYTAITVHIERLTGPEYQDGDLSGIVDLIEVIRIQDSGPTEAARAIRKKLKYGTSHRQLRALTILDGLIQNAGNRFQRTFADEPLLERLRTLPRDELVEAQVREKCNTLFRQWSVAYKGQAGLSGISNLYKELPKKSKPSATQSRVIRETERQAQEDVNPFEEEETPATPPPPQQADLQQHQRRKSSITAPSSSRELAGGSSFPGFSSSSKPKGKKNKRKPFDLNRETPQIMQSIASSSIASTNLLNSLKFVNREAGELPSTSRDVMDRFETCKLLRRQILRYIQLVESDKWIGSLLQANDELVKALMAWELIEKGVEDDSDSDLEGTSDNIRHAGGDGPGVLMNRPRKASRVDEQVAGLSLDGAPRNEQAPPPPRPPRLAPASHLASRKPREEVKEESDVEDTVDEDNPFGDHAAF